MSDERVDMIIGILAALLASSGFWTGFWVWFAKREGKKSGLVQLVLVIAHDRIIYLGVGYIERGWITKDEYEAFITYLYTPYAKFGGNGLAEKVMQDVMKLPIYNNRKIVPEMTVKNPGGP